jgi:glycosyltransferase involved in cell wall biosynthesis
VGDGVERASVAAAIEALAAPAALHPPEARGEVRRRLAACGCAFVSLRTAALVDAVPSKLLEAMALGVPVLLSAAGESARLLREAGGGVVVPPGDDAALRAAVLELSRADASELRSMGEKGRAFVLSRYRRADAAAKLSAVLQEIAA